MPETLTLLLLAVGQSALSALALCAAAHALKGRLPHSALALAGGMAVTGVAGLVTFWAGWLSPALLPVVRGAAALVLLGAVGRAVRHRNVDRELVAACLLIFAAGVVLTLWAHAGTDLSAPLDVAASRWSHTLPSDNRLPFRVAEWLRAGTLHSPIDGDWLVSDRPPLQSGLYLLLQLPGSAGDALIYQITSLCLQMWALAGVYLLTRALGATHGRALLAMAAAFLTPLVLINGIFVWPKLLAAGLAAIPVALVATPLARQTPCAPALAGLLAGAGAALAMTAHGGTAFVLIGLAIAGTVLLSVPPPRWLAAAAAACILVYGPWAAYQRLVDPPGDRLLKMHLAGVGDLDPRPLGTTLRDQYGGLTVDQWLAGRKYNFDIMTSGYAPALEETARAVAAALADATEAEAKAVGNFHALHFFRLPAGLGLLGAALFLLPAGLLVRRFRPLSLTLLVSLAAWGLLMFEPGQTIPHQGSYAPQLALLAMAVAALSGLPAALTATVLAVHAALTIVQYAM